MKTLGTDSHSAIKSKWGMEIQKVNVYQDRYLVGRTQGTLIMVDLKESKVSEVSLARAVMLIMSARRWL